MKTTQIYLSHVREVAFQLAKDNLEYDEPIPDFLTRYPNKLESCIAQPFQMFSGKYLYQGLVSKASILFYLMIKNHPFQNGNKRIAVTTLFVLTYLNRKWINISNSMLLKIAMTVSESNPKDKDKIIEFLEKKFGEKIEKY